jgi:hypothetical protein
MSAHCLFSTALERSSKTDKSWVDTEWLLRNPCWHEGIIPCFSRWFTSFRCIISSKILEVGQRRDIGRKLLISLLFGFFGIGVIIDCFQMVGSFPVIIEKLKIWASMIILLFTIYDYFTIQQIFLLNLWLFLMNTQTVNFKLQFIRIFLRPACFGMRTCWLSRVEFLSTSGWKKNIWGSKIIDMTAAKSLKDTD